MKREEEQLLVDIVTNIVALQRKDAANLDGVVQAIKLINENLKVLHERVSRLERLV